MRKRLRGDRWLLSFVLTLAACRGGIAPDATLVEGRGIEPGLILGTTTLAEAQALVGRTEYPPSSPSPTVEWDIGPYRLDFSPDQNDVQVLRAITGMRRFNPRWANFEGKTKRGIGFLDSDARMRETYGHPDAESFQTGARVFYYKEGVVFVAEHPSSITDYVGPEPTPDGLNITRITITEPFEILEPPTPVRSGQLFLTVPPVTTLRVPVGW